MGGCLLLVLLLAVAAAEQPRPRLHLATFSDIFDPRLMLPLTSAYSHGLAPVVLGLGSEISWATGMAGMWHAYRDFVFNHTEPEDVVIFFDAFDVLFLAGEQKLLDVYLDLEGKLGCSLVYNADPLCSSPRKAEYPSDEASPWRYLNSGVYMGRSRALRRLFAPEWRPALYAEADGRPKRMQNIHTDFFLDHRGLVALDTRCELAQVVFDLEGLRGANSTSTQLPHGLPRRALELRFEDGRVLNRVHGTWPPILHFAGPGHWPELRDEQRMGTCVAYEVLRRIDHGAAELMERRSMNFRGGQYFGPMPWKQVCTSWVPPWDYLGYRFQHFMDMLVAPFLRSWWPRVLSVPVVCLVCWKPVRLLFRSTGRLFYSSGARVEPHELKAF